MQRDHDLPLPPEVKPVRGRRPFLRVVLTLALVGLVIAAFTVRISAFIENSPGPIYDIAELVEVSDATSYSSEGSFYLTTVTVDSDVTAADWIRAAFDANRTIVLREDVTQGATFEELNQLFREQMEASKLHAEEVVLSELGLARPHGEGARVTATVEDAPAFGVLRERDVIVAIEGTKVSTSCDVGRLLEDAEVGEDVELRIRRDGKLRTVTVRPGPHPTEPGTPYLGVFMGTLGYEFDPEVDVRFKTGEIGGPSAGLMMSLALYDRLTPDDLTQGRKIAGTGEIQCDGGVGPIGGVSMKVVAAEEQGADVFLAPAADASEAREVAGDIEVVAVSTFDDALAYLEGLD